MSKTQAIVSVRNRQYVPGIIEINQMLFKTRDKIWCEIPGASYYQVSEDGDVRRHPNKKMKGWGPKRPPGSLLQPCYHDHVDKYLVIRLRTDEGKNIVAKLHQIVCTAFNGPRPTPQHCACHRDDNRHNNKYGNLYWGTKKQNAIDREANGRSGTAHLTLEQVLWAKELYFVDRWRIIEIADIFAVKPQVIRGAISNNAYKWTKVPHVV